MAGYTYLDHIIVKPTDRSDPLFEYYHERAASTQSFVAALFVIAIILFVGARLSRRLRSFLDSRAAKELSVPKPDSSVLLEHSEAVKTFVVPDRKVSLFSFFSLVMEVFISFQDSVIGKENRKHVPFTAAVFFFILFSNFLGLIPGMPTATITVWVNVAIALVVFIYFNTYGIREHGFTAYLKHFMVVDVLVIGLFIFPLEVLSTFMRIITLNLRLYWNIFADHAVLGAFTSAFPPPVGAPVYFLGVFVSFMQAFVFATLTMLYVLFATQHEHEEH
jgi:F-type H+-transporting ATPase subunit a